MKGPIQCQVKKTWWFWLIIGNQELKAFILSWTWCFPGLLFLFTGAVAEARLMRKPYLFYHLQILMPAASSGAYCGLRMWLENSLGWFMGNIIIFAFPCCSSRVCSSVNWLIGHIWVCFHKNVWAIWCPPCTFFPANCHHQWFGSVENSIIREQMRTKGVKLNVLVFSGLLLITSDWKIFGSHQGPLKCYDFVNSALVCWDSGSLIEIELIFCKLHLWIMWSDRDKCEGELFSNLLQMKLIIG